MVDTEETAKEKSKAKDIGREKDYLVISLLIVWTVLCMIFIWAWLNLSRRLSLLESKSEDEPAAISAPINAPAPTVTSTNTTTSAGGSVILGEDEARRERLKAEPELKTSDLAFILGVTNDAITKRIETAEDGTKWFPYGREAYRVVKFQNTYKIKNPFAENPRIIPE